MKRVAIVLAVVTGSGIAVLLVAGRSAGEMAGFARASAETAIERAAGTLPAEVHDRKLDQELLQIRQEMIDRQVQMNLSQRQIDVLQTDVSQLEDSVRRRQQLLAEAYPVLKSATAHGLDRVAFANQDYLLEDFRQEIDDLLLMQDRESRELEVKRTGLTQLRKGFHAGERALVEMRRELDHADQEVALLRSRREQAESESQALDLVATATANSENTAGLMSRSIDRLRGDVDQLEARNAARRDAAPVRLRESRGTVSRGFHRLESLKAIHDSIASKSSQGSAQ